MEFTYQGLVRYAYGFANPNHAAALITILLPFLWALRVYFKRTLFKSAVFCVECLLYFALIFTYSRTGFFVMIMSAVLFWGGKYFFIDKTKWNDVKLKSFLSKRAWTIIAVLFIIAVVAISFKAADRYSSWIVKPEKSVTNRFVIWKGAPTTSTWTVNNSRWNLISGNPVEASSIILNRSLWDAMEWTPNPVPDGFDPPTAGKYIIAAATTEVWPDTSRSDSATVYAIETQVGINGLFNNVVAKSSDSTAQLAYVHWNIDNDNDSSGGTLDHPGGDYLESNTVNNENDLKPLSISVTPSMEEGTVTLNSIGKIWTSSTKGDSTTLLTLPKTWDLSNATERSKFNSVNLYVEGTSNTNGAVSFSFKDGSTTICTASITCHFISANCGKQPLDFVRNRIVGWFPSLVNCEWSITGAYSTVYNCIAWSVAETNTYYNQTGSNSIDLDYGDQDGVFELSDLDDFYDAKGYEQCLEDQAEIMYYNKFHAARVKGCSDGAGKWKIFESKLGRWERIEHRKDQLNGTEYGSPVRFYKNK